MANDIKTWSERVAIFAVDELVDAEIVPKNKFNEAVQIVALEICVRISMGDRPDPNSI
jgi:hypothetical protein